MGEKGEILVVDDASATLKLLADILTQGGYQVHPAGNGEQALSFIAKKLPDLILLDIRMPGMDGFEVFRRLKTQEDTRDIPVIFLSALSEKNERLKGLKLGAVDFIAKPFQSEELLVRVQTHVELHRLRVHLERQAAELRLANERLLSDDAERRRSQEKYHLLAAIVESSSDAIIGKTLDGIVTSWNKSAERIYGYTESEIIGRPISMLVPIGYEDEIPRMMAKIKKGEFIEHYETVRQKKDGDLVSVSISISPVKNAEGKIVSASVIARDITERKWIEKLLRQNEEKFRTIFENNASALAIFEKDTTISMVNREFCRMSLYEKKDVIATSWTKLIVPEDVEKLKEYNRKRLSDPRSSPESYEFSFIRKDGKIRNAIMSVAVIPADKKIVCSFTDMTERKQAEQALREATIEREKLIHELQSTLDNVKTLQGLIPICANCKKIRDDKGYWNQVDGYISKHTDAKFSHGICPECAKRIYGDVGEDAVKTSE